MRALFVSLLLLTASAVADEKPWTVLFDGKSLAGWTSASGGKPGEGWKIEDGALHRVAKAGDLISEKEYTDFELEFDWAVTTGCNSGVKYRVHKTAGGWLGPEYQVLDDAGHENGKVPKTSAGSLYEVIAPNSDKTLKPVGEWNHSRIVARGPVLEHWLNGKMVLSVDTSKPEWLEARKASKFAKIDGFAEAAPGHILLQDHDGEVRFKEIRIRTLEK
ncbi:MAG: hypothetical protein JWO82_3598 [Akkermansiaceae bacterium]|nr:hypothetical protein [Akkermansiaceae bacterium]